MGLGVSVCKTIFVGPLPRFIVSNNISCFLSFTQEPIPPLRLSKKEKNELIEKQKKFFEGDFKRYLKETANEDSSFLVQFVECATGSNYLPQGVNFTINIEFSFAEEALQLPRFHSCTREVVIPGYEIFWSDYDDFKEKRMNFAIKEVFNQFAMK